MANRGDNGTTRAPRPGEPRKPIKTFLVKAFFEDFEDVLASMEENTSLIFHRTKDGWISMSISDAVICTDYTKPSVVGTSDSHVSAGKGKTVSEAFYNEI